MLFQNKDKTTNQQPINRTEPNRTEPNRTEMSQQEFSVTVGKEAGDYMDRVFGYKPKKEDEVEPKKVSVNMKNAYQLEEEYEAASKARFDALAAHFAEKRASLRTDVDEYLTVELQEHKEQMRTAKYVSAISALPKSLETTFEDLVARRDFYEENLSGIVHMAFHTPPSNMTAAEWSFDEVRRIMWSIDTLAEQALSLFNEEVEEERRRREYAEKRKATLKKMGKEGKEACKIRQPE